ncbi:OmpA family protein [Antarctobacter jejuensis]|uniref:OmpA family protein n=1 Tax=Antarctobacter jejuensis TaxID=1439938 RepID=UPI003FD5B24F
MKRSLKRLSVVAAVLLGSVSPAMTQTANETLKLDTSRADQVTAIIKSLAPTAEQPGTPPAPAPPAGGQPPQVIYPLPDVFLPPVVIGRPTTVIIDRRPIVLNYRYSLDLTIYFAYDSAFLTPQARDQLVLVGMALQSPELSNNRYLIAGHTDARGPDAYNTELSYQRAWAVKRYLMRHFGIASWRLEVVGWGERYPRDPNDPYAATNRRVEITLIDTIRPVPPQPQPAPTPPPVAPPQVSSLYKPLLPPCPERVRGIDGAVVPDLDDFTPEAYVDCDPSLPAAGRVIVQPDGRVIVLP